MEASGRANVPLKVWSALAIAALDESQSASADCNTLLAQTASRSPSKGQIQGQPNANQRIDTQRRHHQHVNSTGSSGGAGPYARPATGVEVERPLDEWLSLLALEQAVRNRSLVRPKQAGPHQD